MSTFDEDYFDEIYEEPVRNAVNNEISISIFIFKAFSNLMQFLCQKLFYLYLLIF